MRYDKYTITCIISKTQGLVKVVSLYWTKGVDAFGNTEHGTFFSFLFEIEYDYIL